VNDTTIYHVTVHSARGIEMRGTVVSFHLLEALCAAVEPLDCLVFASIGSPLS